MLGATSVPLLILVSGAAGSGKTTLARQLAARLDVFHLERDALWDGLRFSTARSAGARTPHGIPVWYETIALLMRNSVSLVADGTLYRGEDEENVADVMAFGDVVNVYCRCDDHVTRYSSRKQLDGASDIELNALIARVVQDQPRTFWRGTVTRQAANAAGAAPTAESGNTLERWRKLPASQLAAVFNMIP